jgi:hypothetical protein
LPKTAHSSQSDISRNNKKLRGDIHVDKPDLIGHPPRRPDGGTLFREISKPNPVDLFEIGPTRLFRQAISRKDV